MERWVGVCRGRSGPGGLEDCLAREDEDGSNVLLRVSSVSPRRRWRAERATSRPAPAREPAFPTDIGRITGYVQPNDRAVAPANPDTVEGGLAQCLQIKCSQRPTSMLATADGSLQVGA